MRTLRLASGTWRWKAGRAFVRVRSPGGKTYVVPLEVVKRVEAETFYRARRKKTSFGAVTPNEVRAWIETPGAGRCAV